MSGITGVTTSPGSSAFITRSLCLGDQDGPRMPAVVNTAPARPSRASVLSPHPSSVQPQCTLLQTSALFKVIGVQLHLPTSYLFNAW